MNLVERIDDAVHSYERGDWPIETNYEKRMIPLLTEASKALVQFEGEIKTLRGKLNEQEMRWEGFARHVIGTTFKILFEGKEHDTAIKGMIEDLNALLTGEG